MRKRCIIDPRGMMVSLLMLQAIVYQCHCQGSEKPVVCDIPQPVYGFPYQAAVNERIFIACRMNNGIAYVSSHVCSGEQGWIPLLSICNTSNTGKASDLTDHWEKLGYQSSESSYLFPYWSINLTILACLSIGCSLMMVLGSFAAVNRDKILQKRLQRSSRINLAMSFSTVTHHN